MYVTKINWVWKQLNAVHLERDDVNTPEPFTEYNANIEFG
jgi:hypothetical protein